MRDPGNKVDQGRRETLGTKLTKTAVRNPGGGEFQNKQDRDLSYLLGVKKRFCTSSGVQPQKVDSASFCGPPIKGY